MFAPDTQEEERAALVIRTHDDDRAVVVAEASTAEEEEEEEQEGTIARRRAKATTAPNGRRACFPGATIVLEVTGKRTMRACSAGLYMHHRHRYTRYTPGKRSKATRRSMLWGTWHKTVGGAFIRRNEENIKRFSLFARCIRERPCPSLWRYFFFSLLVHMRDIYQVGGFKRKPHLPSSSRVSLPSWRTRTAFVCVKASQSAPWKVLNPFRTALLTAVPCRGQASQIPSSVSPKRDYVPKRVHSLSPNRVWGTATTVEINM